jgi:hypothetical protein
VLLVVVLTGPAGQALRRKRPCCLICMKDNNIKI